MQEPWIPCPEPHKPGVVEHTCYPSTSEAEARDSRVQGHPQQQGEFAASPVLDYPILKGRKTEEQDGEGEQNVLRTKLRALHEDINKHENINLFIKAEPERHNHLIQAILFNTVPLGSSSKHVNFG